jgi:hypothetical protein
MKKPSMIGPHEGRELELMLSGQKKLAVFHDIIIPGQNIPEGIIPEQAFFPYVQAGTIIRTEEKITNKKTGDIIQNVLFTLPGEEWRASTILWIKRDVFQNQKRFDEAYDIIIGRLLGYTEDEISAFLFHQKRLKL